MVRAVFPVIMRFFKFVGIFENMIPFVMIQCIYYRYVDRGEAGAAAVGAPALAVFFNQAAHPVPAVGA